MLNVFIGFDAAERRRLQRLILAGRAFTRTVSGGPNPKDPTQKIPERFMNAPHSFAYSAEEDLMGKSIVWPVCNLSAFDASDTKMHLLAPAPAAVIEPPRSNTELTDSEAVHAVLGGKREMFEIIVRRYNAQLYRVGMAYLRNHPQTEDAMQNAYVKAFTNLHRFKGTAAFSTWLTRIMINECLMTLRAQKRFRSESIDEPHRPEHLELLAPAAADPIHAQEMKALLEQSIAVLPRMHRAVYLLREIQHLSTAETAECLGLSRENVKVCLHRARDGLKAELLNSSAGLEVFNYPAAFCDPMTARVMRAILTAPSPASRAEPTIE
jgi:RNA polymerase sigma-70 factor (ECF subfamily)